MARRRMAHWRARMGALALLAGCLGSPPALAAATGGSDNPAPPGCGLLWRVTASLDTTPRQLQVDMAFDAGPRGRSTLRLPGGWAAMVELAASAPAGAPASASASTSADASAEIAIARPRLQAVAGAPALRTVDHAPGERVQLRWRFTPPDSPDQASGVELAADWFALVGQGVLPVPDELDERNPPTACIGLTLSRVLAEAQQAGDTSPASSAAGPVRWATSHGNAEGPSALFRVAAGGASLRSRVQQALYAGGALQALSFTGEGQALTVARPAALPWRFTIEALARASAQAAAAQRRFWGDGGPPGPLLVLLLPGPTTPQGTAWHQALALQAPADLALPGSGFDALVTQALVRSWVPDRFGPVGYIGRGDLALRAWFGAGFADHYTHRQLLRDGRWTPEDYASVLNRKIAEGLDSAPGADAPPGATASGPGNAASSIRSGASGEWLALQWHAALRAKGQPGLDAVMRRLVVPAAAARHEGPISAPLATHRLVAALRPVLGDAPLRDINRHIEQAEPFKFDPTALGPCFVGQRLRVPTWRLGFDAGSLSRRVLSGVEPGGPAEAAGLRDGMVLAGHLLTPGDATQPVQLQLRAADGSLTEIRYLPAGELVRELPRFQPVAQAMQQAACQGWLGLGPEAALASGSHRPTVAGAGPSGAQAAGKHNSRTGSKASAKRASKPGAKADAKAGAQSGSAGKALPKSGAKAAPSVKIPASPARPTRPARPPT